MHTDYGAAAAHELKNFLDGEGRLIQFPSKFKLKIMSLFYLASKFEHGRQYSEKEVNELLIQWHSFDDWAMLRREMYNKRFIGREQDGSSYWIEECQPELVDFGLE